MNKPTVVEFIETEVVNAVPWNVDATHKYEIKCKANEWVDRSRDGRWYKMNLSGRKGFKGTRKTDICKGSIMCENTACTKLLTMGVWNTNEFTYENCGYVCKCCRYFAAVENCGCKKSQNMMRRRNCLLCGIKASTTVTLNKT